MANIIPLPKTKNSTAVTDYRPIALTSELCKVLERIIMKEIIKLTKKFVSTNEKNDRNTMDAILKVLDDWERAKDSDLIAHKVDFKKAFDVVIHLILLKLENILPKWMTTWIAEYLND